jgi:hypothetical protein
MPKQLDELNNQMRSRTVKFLWSATSERYYNIRQTCEAVTLSYSLHLLTGMNFLNEKKK